MTPEDERIDEIMNEVEEKTRASFDGELFLSTDGKHTVRVFAKTYEGRREALSWAKMVYEGIVKAYGTKQAQAVKEYGNGKKEDLGKCEKCGAENKMSQKGKVYCSAKCWLKGGF